MNDKAQAIETIRQAIAETIHDIGYGGTLSTLDPRCKRLLLLAKTYDLLSLGRAMPLPYRAQDGAA